MNHRQIRVEFLGLRVCDNLLLEVPATTFKEYTVNVAPILRLLFHLCVSHVVNDLKLEPNLIDSDDMLSCKVLKGSCDKGLREEESRDPENIGCPIVYPLLEEIHSID